MELFRLFGSILIDDKDALAKLKKVDKRGRDTSTNLEKVVNVGAKIGSAVATGAGIAYGALNTLASKTAEHTDKWDKLSERTGIGVENLQKWGYAAGQSGADIGKLEVGMKKLSDTMVDAQNGSKTAQNAYQKLGISMQELETMTPEQAFETVMYSLADMEEGAERNAIGNDLLGKSYTELLPLLNAGSGGMNDLKARAEELGLVMDESAIKSGVVFGDTLADVKSSLGAAVDKIMIEMMPALTEMLNWILAHMPEIQNVTSLALNGVKDAIQFVTDHSNILIPVLAGLLGGFVALKVIGIISGLMSAYTAITTTATGVQVGLNAVLMANPIALVIVAITALIAAGVALYQNWDTVKAYAEALWATIETNFNAIKEGISKAWDAVKTKTKEVWDNIKSIIESLLNAIKSSVQTKIEGVKTVIENTWNLVKTVTQGTWDVIKSVIEAVWNVIKSLVTGNVDNVKDAIKSGWENVKSTTTNTWNAIKDAIMKPLNSAWDAVKNVVQKMKNVFNFSWKLPHLKIPHLSITGGFSIMPPKVPKFGISWHRFGGILNRATPFGMNGSNLMVGGEVPGEKEAILPLNAKNLAGIGEGIWNSSKTRATEKLDIIIELLRELLEKTSDIFIDGEKVSKATWKYDKQNFDRDNKISRRKRGVTFA